MDLNSTQYDLVIIGGGIAGATLARSMSSQGSSVLVVEKTTTFKDRVRGDGMTSWGAELARDLDIYDVLLSECAHELPNLDIYVGGVRISNRDLLTSTPKKTPFFTFYHPEMQESLIRMAAKAGACVARNAQVTAISPGERPSALVKFGEKEIRVTGRLIVAADGRTSAIRKWASLPVEKDPDHLEIAGVLLEGIETSMNTASLYFNPSAGKAAYLFPQREGRVRAYAVQRTDAGPSLSGERRLQDFLRTAAEAGLPKSQIESAHALGPLASFNGAAYWVPKPYRDGIALIGDAAACSDPVWGEGLSLALHDVKVLSKHLSKESDWATAGSNYADEHAEKFAVTHKVCNWYAEMFLRTGSEATTIRERAFPLLAQDPSRIPDLFALGADTPHDEKSRQRFFGEV